MAKINALSILLEDDGKDFLNELYAEVIDSVQKSCVSDMIKNKDLSGDPKTGAVEAKKFANAVSAEYGSARSSGKGDSLKAKSVTVSIDCDREIVEEIGEKDILLYGVDGLLENRAKNHRRSMVRELERAFFAKAAEEAAEFTPDGEEDAEILEELIQELETTRNDYVDGVDRDMISVIAAPAVYGKIRSWLDTIHNASVDSSKAEFSVFHGVKVFPSVYLPAGVKMLAMMDGAVAQPVLPRPYAAEKIPLSEAYAVSLFYYYGVEAVMPEVIFKISE